jgi:hypothetical protein
METPVYSKFQTTPIWKSNEDSFKNLDYINEDFNDTASVEQWLAQGYSNKFTGDMCDMRSVQPHWNYRIIRMFEKYGWKDIGTSYYRMRTGTVLPTHSDLYTKYVTLFNLQGKEHRIRRAIIFLEDWKPGHYSEIAGQGIINWHAGDVIEWAYDTPHAAANIGLEDRYTLQITGWV